MKALRFLLIGVGALLLTSCSSDEPNVNDNDGVRGDDAEKYELNAGLYDTAEECGKAHPGRDGGAPLFYFAVENVAGNESTLKYMTENQYYEVSPMGALLAVNKVGMKGYENKGNSLYVGDLANQKSFKYENIDTNLSDIDGCTGWTTIETEDDIQKLLAEAPDAELVWRTSWRDYVDIPWEYGDLYSSDFGKIGISIPVNKTGKTRVMAWTFGADHIMLALNPNCFKYHYRHPLLIVQRAK